MISAMRVATMLSSRALLACGTAVLLAGCILGNDRGYALYPNPGHELARQEVASLAGYVMEVDGHDVSSHGGSFELLPGCHVIGTPSKWGTMTATSGAVITTGRLTFALPMKAGHQYVIEVGSSTVIRGPTESAFVMARELDQDGNTTRSFGPATSTLDLETCRNEAQK